MGFASVFNQIFVLFALLSVGYVARRKKLIHGDINGQLSDLLILVFLPCTIVSSLLEGNPIDALRDGALVFVIAFCTHAFSILLGALLYRKMETGVRRVLWFMTVFSNSAFIGYPVMESMYGRTGVLYGAFYGINFSLFVWTFGYALFSGRSELKMLRRVIFSPGMIAIGAGVLLSLLPFRLPAPVLKTINHLGSLTTPLCMIVIGSTLAEIRVRDVLSGWHIYLGSAMRLLVVPFLTLGALTALGVGGMVRGVSVIAVAMPAGTFTVIFAKKFDGDAHLATRCVFFSTAAAAVTIPLVLLVMSRL